MFKLPLPGNGLQEFHTPLHEYKLPPRSPFVSENKEDVVSPRWVSTMLDTFNMTVWKCS